MEIVLIIGSIVIAYFVIGFFRNGAKRRAKIISNLILVAEANGGEFTTDDIFYEAVEKFVLENGGSILSINTSCYIVIGENKVTFYRVGGSVMIQIKNYAEFNQDVIDRATGRGKYYRVTVSELLNDFNASLPKKINEEITLKSVFGDKDYVWMIFEVPDEKDTRLYDEIKEIIKDTSFVKSIKELGASITMKISTESGKNSVTATLDDGYFDITAPISSK